MSPVTPEQFDYAADVLFRCFRAVPRMVWLVKQDEKKGERMRILCRHCITVAMKRDGAFLSSDKQGLALVFKSTKRLSIFTFLREYFILGQKCIGWSRAWRVISQERRLASARDKAPHLHFWMMAVGNGRDGIKTSFEIKNFVFRLSQELKLPVLSETTVVDNLPVYYRMGYRIYNEVEFPGEDFKMWFLVRDWDAPSVTR